MPRAHREDDERFCDALTIVIGQSTVKVNNKLWAVEDDPNTHGNGLLLCTYGPRNVFIEGKHAIVAIGDSATADNFPHFPPDTHPKGFSPNVYVYE
jgi:hypothetical protein